MRGVEYMDEYHHIAGKLLSYGHPETTRELAEELRKFRFLPVVHKYRRREERRLRNIREKRRMAA